MPDDIKHRFNQDVENIVTRQIVDYEWDRNSQSENNLEFASLIDMLELKRTDKDYSWMSDIEPPILASFMNTDASMWANQYFQTRDFVEVKLDGTGPEHVEKCRASKKVLNSSLNRRKLYYYHKYIRARLINALRGNVYAVCWWEKSVDTVQVGVKQTPEMLNVDIEGNPLRENWQELGQSPAIRMLEEPVEGKRINYDHFNFDIVDPRNVRTDNSYCYSVQDKPWIIIRRETTYEKLSKLGKRNGYFNLDVVKSLVKNQVKTNTAKETYENNIEDGDGSNPVSKKFDVLLRFGEMWSIVKKRDENGYPIQIELGYDDLGEPLKNAELIETISETVYTSGGQKILIRYQPCPFIDSKGNIYRPILRGWCYIHPTKDTGLSSGKNIKEIQKGIADNFNMGQDRVKLATLPTLKAGPSITDEDMDEIYFEPQHVIPIRGDVRDLEEFKISDNIDGVAITNNMLSGWAQQTEAIYPTTMGDMPGKASTTATAVAGGESRSNLRGNYKSLTFEYTFLVDLYSIDINMTWQFAEPETLDAMCGEDAQYFDPAQDYTYSPVSSNIEQEYNKKQKILNYDQTMSRIIPMIQPLPELVPIIAHIIKRQLELQGDEYQDVGEMIGNLSKAKVRNKEGESAGGGMVNQPNTPEIASSNQSGNPMSMQEEQTRMGMEGLR
jgi:hypothetical protein